MKRKLGGLETQFFAYVQMRGLRRVRTGELTASVLRLQPAQADTEDSLGIAARHRGDYSEEVGPKPGR